MKSEDILRECGLEVSDLKLPTTAMRYQPALKFIKKGVETTVKKKYGIAPLLIAGAMIAATTLIIDGVGKALETKEMLDEEEPVLIPLNGEPIAAAEVDAVDTEVTEADYSDEESLEDSEKAEQPNRDE